VCARRCQHREGGLGATGVALNHAHVVAGQRARLRRMCWAPNSIARASLSGRRGEGEGRARLESGAKETGVLMLLGHAGVCGYG
jgi:hypothetical protein